MKRAGPAERVLARVSRSGGPSEVWCREIRIWVAGDEADCFRGAKLAVDITQRSAICATGEPQPEVAEVGRSFGASTLQQGERTSRAGHVLPDGVVGSSRLGVGVPKWRIFCGSGRRGRHARCRHSCSIQSHWCGNAGGTFAFAVSFVESLVEPSECLIWCHTDGLATFLSHDLRWINVVFLIIVVPSLQIRVKTNHRVQINIGRPWWQQEIDHFMILRRRKRWLCEDLLGLHVHQLVLVSTCLI